MTGTLRYISWIVWTLLLLNFACNDSEKSQTGEEDRDGIEEVVELFLTVPQTYSTTHPGSISEKTIKELDILVFKNDEFLYKREGKKSVSSYRTTLKIDEDLTLYFLVNSRELVENNSTLVEGNSWDNEIRESFIWNTPEDLIASDALPMWGIAEKVTIEEGVINQIDNIFLLRSVASVDIFNFADPEVFVLKEAYLYFVPDQGYVAPSKDNYVAAQKAVSQPESPSNMQNLTYPVSSNVTDGQSLVYQLYLYENDAPASTTAPKRHSRIVVGGSFKGGETTYYPVDFLEDDLSKVIPVTRNYKYIISIGDVKSEGFPDPDTASEEFDTRLDIDIIDWNMKDENEIIFDGPWYISLESKKVFVYRPEGSTSTLEFTTSIPLEELNMEFIDSGNGTTVTGTNTIENDRFRVEIILDKDNKIIELRFTALQDYNTTNISSNIQLMRIYSKRIETEITIEQVNESPTDWIDGGNTGIELGEEEE